MAEPFGEIEELKTCCICFYEYDNDEHKPKFLSCHHTFCIGCIKALPRINRVVTCPKCNSKTACAVNQVDTKLTTNPYALHMAAQPTFPPHEGHWCTMCKREALPSCMKDHVTLSMGSKSAEFCSELQKSKDLIEAQVGSIIEKRIAARKYLHKVSNAHKLVGESIRRFEEENNVHLAHTNSLLENFGTIQPGETAQSLSLKLEEAMDLIKEELMDVEVLDKQYLKHINGQTKITFDCHREGKKVPISMPLYEQKAHANDRGGLEQIKMLKSATYVLLSLLKIGDNHPEAEAEPTPSTSGATNLQE